MCYPFDCCCGSAPHTLTASTVTTTTGLVLNMPPQTHLILRVGPVSTYLLLSTAEAAVTHQRHHIVIGILFAERALFSSRAADTVILVRAQSLHGTKKDSCSPRIHRLKAVTHLGSTLYALWDVTALCNPCEWVLLSRNLQKKDFNLFELRARGLPTSTFGIRLWHLTT